MAGQPGDFRAEGEYGERLQPAGPGALDLPAVEWLEAGIALARERGDGKALGELESALAAARE